MHGILVDVTLQWGVSAIAVYIEKARWLDWKALMIGQCYRNVEVLRVRGSAGLGVWSSEGCTARGSRKGKGSAVQRECAFPVHP